jgi:GH25 family lysozyme M1 (1,4-beta-N-acetylmuramidase)
MPVPSHHWWAFACCTLASLSLASGLSAAALTAAGAATAAQAARATGARAGHAAARSFSRYNVGATHSPQLLSMLAGPGGGAAPASPGRAAPTRAPAGRLKGAEQGVDVASFQHPNGKAINWRKAHTAGIRFAGVKTTEGAYYRNPYALTDLAQARAAKLAVVAYAFAIPNGNGASSKAATQASYLLSYLGTQSRTVPIMLDIEYNPYGGECYGLSTRAMVAWVSAFSGRIKAKTGRKPIIYTPPRWWATCTGGNRAFGKASPVWVPDYTSSGSPALPAGWSTWSLWQYTSTGTVRGIPAPGSTDLDQANPVAAPVLGRPRWLSGRPPLADCAAVAGRLSRRCWPSGRPLLAGGEPGCAVFAGSRAVYLFAGRHPVPPFPYRYG